MGGLAHTLAQAHVPAGERILWSARPSLVGLVPILVYAALALLGIGLSRYYGVDEPGLVFRGSAALVVAVGGVLVEATRRFIRLRFTTFVVTDQRFYAITSFFETNARSIPLSRATHVALRQGPFARALGLWNAQISTYGARSERRLEIPAIRDGEGLLRELSAGMRRGANVAWLRSGD